MRSGGAGGPRGSGLIFVLCAVACSLAVASCSSAGGRKATPKPQASSPEETRTPPGPVAVLITGYGFEGNRQAVESMESLAAYLSSKGVEVRKFYDPDNRWSDVRGGMRGANIVVYLGHGSGCDPGEGERASAFRNGFIFNTDDSFPETADWESLDYSRNYGTIGRFVIQEDVALAPDALVIVEGACYSNGRTNTDVGTVPIDYMRCRIEEYAETFLEMGASYLFCDPGPAPDAAQLVLSRMIDEGKTLEAARDEVASAQVALAAGGRATTERYPHPGVRGAIVKFDHYEVTGADPAYNWTALPVAGNLTLDAAAVLGRR